MILIAIPTFKYVESECFITVYEQEKPCETQLDIIGSYSVDVARNLIVKEAKDRNAECIFWVDADILLPKDALKNLYSHDKDIVSGVYTYKIFNNKNIVAKRYKEKNKYEDLEFKKILEEPNPLEVDAFGFGCVLTKTEVFNKIKYPWFRYSINMGEDVYFCRKAQAAGYKLYLDNRVLCGHKGEVNFNLRG